MSALVAAVFIALMLIYYAELCRIKKRWEPYHALLDAEGI